MSRLEQLMRELCPDGVEFFEVGDLCKTQTPKIKIKSNDYSEEGTYPIIDQGQAYIGGYTNEEGAFPKGEYVIFGDHTCVVKFVNFEFVQGADGVKVLKAYDNIIIPKYLYYCMSNIKLDSAYARHWTKMKAQSIPVPPLEVQREIVRILDNFTELTAELTAELTVRKQQFEYYRCKLLTFNEQIEYYKLGECCTLRKGATPIQKAKPGIYPLVVTTAERKSSENYQFNQPTVCIPLVSSRGHGVACLNQLYYQEGKFALGNILCGVTPNDERKISAKFLFYYLNHKKDTIIVPLMKGGANVSVTVDSLARIKVPIPPLNIQHDIVRILDKFTELTTDLKFGLPAEIAARQKQYEYYRDQLLSFPVKAG